MTIFDEEIKKYNQDLRISQETDDEENSVTENVFPEERFDEPIPDASTITSLGNLGKQNVPDILNKKIAEKRFLLLNNSYLSGSSITFQYRRSNSHQDIDDNFRFAHGSFWISTTERSEGVRIYREIDDKASPTQQAPLSINKTNIFSSSQGPLGAQKEHVYVSSAPDFALGDFFYGEGNYTSPLMKENEKHFDITFRYTSPIRRSKEVERTKISSWKLESEYNFYINGYEEVVDNFDTTLAPNIYSLLEQTSTENFADEVEEHNTLNGRLDPIFSRASQNQDEMGLFSNSQFLDEWARAVDDVSENEEEQITEPYENIYLSSRDLRSEEYKRAGKEYSHLFPFYNKITFDVDANAPISQMVADSKFEETFFNHFQGRNTQFKEFLKSTANFGEEFFTGDKDIEFERGAGLENTWYMNPWVKSLDPEENLPESIDTKNSIKFTLDESDKSTPLINVLLQASLWSKLNDFRERFFRDFEDVMEGEEAYSEVVLYEIRKHSAFAGDQVEDEKEQSIFFLNSNEVEILDYIDTQVKFEQLYQYQVFSYHLVMGNEYEYVPPSRSEPFKGKITRKSLKNTADFYVENKPSYWLVKQKLFETSVSQITDNPPIYPDVSFNSYNNVDDKFLITMSQQIGDREEFPEVIEEGDVDFFENLNTKTKFETDSVIKSYEIFRTDEEPSSYTDFADGRKVTVSTFLDKIGEYTDRSSYKDSLEPNKTYYYTFRAIDIHDKVSNPSKVFEVTMRSEDGLIIPQVERKEIEEFRDKPDRQKTMRQFLQIGIPLDQMMVDEEKTNFGEEYIKLGTLDKKTWGRNYKIRLTSNSSGKSVDINFKPTYRQDFGILLTGTVELEEVELKPVNYKKFEKFFVPKPQLNNFSNIS